MKIIGKCKVEFYDEYKQDKFYIYQEWNLVLKVKFRKPGSIFSTVLYRTLCKDDSYGFDFFLENCMKYLKDENKLKDEAKDMIWEEYLNTVYTRDNRTANNKLTQQRKDNIKNIKSLVKNINSKKFTIEMETEELKHMEPKDGRFK